MSSLVRTLFALSLVLFLALSCADNAIDKTKIDPAGEAAGEPETIEEEPVVTLDTENLPDNPKVLITTSLGEITLELDNVNAPISTKNFLTYVQNGFYDDTIFHRVMPTFMIQGGGFTKSLYENSSARPKTTRDPIRNEATNGLSNLRGTIAMARTGRTHSATCQFFINVVDNGYRLDHVNQDRYGYAVFGQVTTGMDTVDTIRNAMTRVHGRHEALPIDPIVIQSIRVVE